MVVVAAKTTVVTATVDGGAPPCCSRRRRCRGNLGEMRMCVREGEERHIQRARKEGQRGAVATATSIVLRRLPTTSTKNSSGREKLSLPMLDRACCGGVLRGMWRKEEGIEGRCPFIFSVRCTLHRARARQMERAVAFHWRGEAVLLRSGRGAVVLEGRKRREREGNARQEGVASVCGVFDKMPAGW
jgi:hypothetical protein